MRQPTVLISESYLAILFFWVESLRTDGHLPIRIEAMMKKSVA